MAEFLPSAAISKRILTVFLNLSFVFLILLCCFTFKSSDDSSFSLVRRLSSTDSGGGEGGCGQLHQFSDREAKCRYVKSHEGCQNGGYIDYLRLFYCNFDPVLGYSALMLWLVVLFYLLGNTAANYFCSSLEGLSRILKLSPNVAGVTLLSLGNGAPDLFSSIVSFMGDDTSSVGLNSILGGAFFVSSVVVGIISLCVCRSRVSIESCSFFRDVTFFLFTLACLLLILVLGKINLWLAISFFSLYLIYALFISTSHLCCRPSRKKEGLIGDDDDDSDHSCSAPILPVSNNFLQVDQEPLLGGNYSYAGGGDDEKPILLLEKVDQKQRSRSSSHLLVCRVLFFLELPLYLPRRLTIPVIAAERWSKPFAVISVTVAPVLVAMVWSSHGSGSVEQISWVAYLMGGGAGVISGVVAYFTTERSTPPTKWQFPWLAGGFLMSITWTYIAAEELISLLASLGTILGISYSILGLTVLAWGNSIGDLVSNVSMAVNGGEEGAQVAISGCYAGPIFNTLVGLGLPLAFSAWSQYPADYLIPSDSSDYETMGFLMGGLLWALVILPNRNMKLDRFLGAGLLAIYLCFLSLRIARALIPLPI